MGHKEPVIVATLGLSHRGGHRIAACRETYSEHVYTPGRVSNEAADTALLIRRVQAGDDHAVEVLIDRSRPVIRAVLLTRYLVGQTQADMWSLATEYTLVALRDYRPGRGHHSLPTALPALAEHLRLNAQDGNASTGIQHAARQAERAGQEYKAKVQRCACSLG